MLCAAADASSGLDQGPERDRGLDQALTQAVQQLNAGDADAALGTLDALVRSRPDFRPGQLLYGELLSALSGMKIPSLMALPALGGSKAVAKLLDETRLRIAAERAAPAPGAQPDVVLTVPDSTHKLVLVDLAKARLYLMENTGGKLAVLQQHYAAMGRNGIGKQSSGDLRTPLGVYRITGWIGDDQLPDLYGAGALPLNYPNAWDRLHGRTGSGIWLHGVPRTTYARAPRSSEGCVTMANEDLIALRKQVGTNTPVVLSDGIRWRDAAESSPSDTALRAAIEDWRTRWAARDTAAYLAYYAEDFHVDSMDLAAFAAHKRRVNAARSFIEVGVEGLSVYRYPGADGDLHVADFVLDYRSDHFASHSRKQQFWRQREDGRWMIVREINRPG